MQSNLKRRLPRLVFSHVVFVCEPHRFMDTLHLPIMSVTMVPFASLIACLGPTMGRKTTTVSQPVPEWIMTGTDNVKREFLSRF